MILRYLNLAFIPDIDAYLMAAVLSVNIMADAELDISFNYVFRLPSRSLRNIYKCSISFIALNYVIYSAFVNDTVVVV